MAGGSVGTAALGTDSLLCFLLPAKRRSHGLVCAGDEPCVPKSSRTKRSVSPTSRAGTPVTATWQAADARQTLHGPRRKDPGRVPTALRIYFGNASIRGEASARFARFRAQ